MYEKRKRYVSARKMRYVSPWLVYRDLATLLACKRTIAADVNLHVRRIANQK